jgi:type IV secretory pathway VirB2 component (pilin)
MNVPKRFKAMSALVLLHGSLIVIDNLYYMLQGGFSTLTMLVILLEAALSLLIGYLILTRRLLIILGVSLLFAYLLSLVVGQFTNQWPPVDVLVWLLVPFHFLADAIYILEVIIPLLGVVILFMGIKTGLQASRT